MLKKIWRIQWLIALLLVAFLPAQPSEAKVRGVHSAVTCGTCHTGNFTVSLFDQDPTCLNNTGSCHQNKQIAEADASQLLNYTGGVPLGTSHAWGVPYNNADGGSSAPARIAQSRYAPSNLGCSSCHYPHYYLNNITSQPLLKKDNSEDQLCLDCHRSRNVTSASPPPAGKQGSHPVGVTIPATSAFNTPPLDPYGVSGSELKLLGAGSDTVSCSTCHGVHFADSNPYTAATYDVLSSVPGGQGVLLRRYNDTQLCKDCHRFQQHGPADSAKWMDCRVCHDPHLGAGTNFRLIFSTISTPFDGDREVVLDNLTSGFIRRLDGKFGMCDVCHDPFTYPAFAGWSTGHAGKGLDMPNIHTVNCLSCHPHAEGDGSANGSFAPGGAAACGTCHGYPPMANYSGPPDGYANDYDLQGYSVDESTSPHAKHADVATGYGGRFANSGAYGEACKACHKMPDESTHQDSVLWGDYGFELYTWAGGARSYDNGTHNCSEVYCHSDGAPNGSITYTTPNWGAGTLDCAGCHESSPTTNKHTKHIEGSGLNFSFGCKNCHDGTVDDDTTISATGISTNHVDKVKSVFFGATGVSGSYAAGAKECSDTYCHGNLADNQGNSGNKPVFNGAATVCGSCHALPPSGDIVTHTKHVTTYEFECAYCHYDLITTWDNMSSIDDQTKHVNYNEDVLFGNDGEGRTNAAGSYNSGSGICDTIYCHSAGTSTLSANFFVNESTVWNSATVTCASCHGNSVYSGMTSSMPNYDDEGIGGPKQNSHKEHVVDNGIDCMTCHEVTLATNVTISNYTAHVNSKYNVDIDSAYGGTYAAGTCNSVSCHGGNSVDWGDTTVGCSSCHNTDGVDVDDFVFSNLSGTAALINFAQYTSTGHGRNSAFPSGNLAASKGCTDCHDSSVAHGAPGNPFRLYSSNPDELCDTCHGPNAGTPADKTGIFNHSSSTTDGRYDFKLKCVDCHDPHGDDNAFMLHSTLPRVDDQGYEPSNQYGVPNPGVTWRDIDFPSNSAVFLASTSDVRAPIRVCNVCHTQTVDYDGPDPDTLKRYNYDMSGNPGTEYEEHYVGNQCTTSCHKHTNGFEGVSCAGCHGMPPAAGLMLEDFGAYDTSPTGEGAHARHGQIYISGPRCNVCHDKSIGGMDPSGTLNTTLDINFKADGLLGSYTTGSYDATGAAHNPSYNGSVGSGGTYVCSNVKCHGVALASGNGTDTTPIWTTPATGACGKCHGAKTDISTAADGGTGYPGSGAHQKHAGWAAGEYDIMCQTCHDTTLTTATTFVDTIHVNAETGVTGMGIESAYDDTANFNYVDGTDTCENTDCHGENSVVWTAGAQTCDTCHNGASDVDNWTYSNLSGTVAKIDSTEWTNDGHINFGKDCDACHDGSVDHSNGGTYFRLYSTTDPDTFCLYCHGSGAELKAGWFGNKTGIQSHTYDNMSTAAYANLTTWAFTPKCIDCHDPHGDTNDMMMHDDLNFFGSDATGKPTGGTTSVSAAIFDRWSSYVRADFTGTCQVCHERTAYFKKNEFNGDHNNTGGKCPDCHPHSLGFTPAGGDCDTCHLDATKDVDDFVYGNANKALIKTSEWEAGAHFANDVGCYSCHDGDVAHDTGTNPFRLHTSDTIALCDNCHGTGGALGIFTTANASSTGIFTHNSSIVDNGNSDFSIKCVDCHDPHGDADNMRMIHDDLAESNIGNGYTPSNQYGQPFEQNTSLWMNVDFTANAVGTDFATEAANDDISKMCNVCHQRTVDPLVPANERFQQDMNLQPIDSHNANTKCVNCHAHTGGFKGVPCDGCHGNPPVDLATLIGGTGTDQTQTLSGSNTAGAHQRHKDALGVQILDECGACHNTGMSQDGGVLNTTLDVDFTWGTYTTGTYDGQTAADAVYPYAGTPVPGTGDSYTCANVKCHGDGGWLAGGSDTDPEWNVDTTGDCGTCHAVKKNPGDDATGLTTNAHVKHVDFNSYDIMCDTCHSGEGADTATILSNNTTLDDTVHVNEKASVDLKDSESRLDTNSVYTGLDTVNSDFGVCNETYCHSQGTDLVAPFTAAVDDPISPATWSDSAVGCNYCHDGTATGPSYTPGVPKFNSHSTHVVGEGFGCEDCHNVTTTDGTTIANFTSHVNGAYNVDLIGTYDVGSFNFNAGTSECSDVTCHGGDTTMIRAGATGNDIDPIWGDSTYGTCSDGNCHLNGTSTPKITHGSHVMHTDGTGVNYSFACTDCHTADTHANHIDGSIDFTDSQGKALTNACDYCHFVDNDNIADAKTEWNNGTDRTCISCHNAKATEGSMLLRHPQHINSGTYSSFKCAYCHSKTVAVGDDNVIDNKANHANAVKDVYFNSFQNNSTNGSFASRQCLNIYCHSNGTDLAGPYTDANDDPRVTPDWDVAGGMNCNGCHGSTAYADFRDAMPNYADESPKNNSHVEHVVDNGIDCMSCHNTTLSANNTIGNYALHLDGNYDVSMPAKYVGSYAGGTCTNVTCHGGAGSSVDWGTPTVDCQACHFDNTADLDDYTWTNITSATMAIAQIYSSDWAARGHGLDSGSTYPDSTNNGAQKVCSNCHDSGVTHFDATNPFRVTAAYKDDPNGLCMQGGCHDTYQSHTLANLTSAGYASDAPWAWTPKCIDCHDPHGDANDYMIHDDIADANSSAKGVPSTTTSMVFDSAGASLAGSDYTKAAFDGICQKCHTTDANMQHHSQNKFDGHNIATRCTSCHDHAEGFNPGAGESPGGVTCSTCHGTLLTGMQSNSDYHHYMQNDATTYPSDTAPTVQDTDKKCLMCHVDHDVFSPANNPGKGARARNLRSSVSTTPLANTTTTFVPTDFYPQNPKYDAETKPYDQPTDNGVCISCHEGNQTKNQTGTDRYDDGSTTARSFTRFLYYSSSHNFQVITAINNFGDDSSFRANCAKCHASSNNNTIGAQSGSFQFGLHNKDAKSLINGNSGTLDSVDISTLCFKCHSKDSRASGGGGDTYDLYSSVVMNGGSKLIKSAVTAKTYGHPQGANPTAHDPAEAIGVSQGWNAGASRHVECVDCHNTHGGNANIVRVVGSSTGNGVAGAQKGVWGVSMTHGAAGTTPSYSYLPEANMQAEVCLKCHSDFGYNGSPPVIPSGAPDPSVETSGALYDTIISGELETDQSVEFNPNNPGYHPVLAPGRNQPTKSESGNSWPATTSVEYMDPYTNQTSFMNVSGLGWTFVPPWSQGSTMGCSDCHAADNTGEAVSSFGGNVTLVQGDWTGDAVSGTLDANDASMVFTAAATGTNQEVDLTGASYPGSATRIEVALYINHSAGKNKTFSYVVDVSSVLAASGNITMSTTGGSFVRGAVDITAGMTTQSCLTAACIESNVTVEFGAGVAGQITKVAVEAYYPFTEKLRGPHGSLNRWILETANKDIHFKVGGSYVYPNSDIAAGSTEEKVFCFNCHRRDVYGKEGGTAGTYPTYSRVSHPAGAGQHAAVENPWGIFCMNCHGGRGPTSDPSGIDTMFIGGIHGVYATSTVYGLPFFSTTGSKTMNRPLGVRLLYGATMIAAADDTDVYCYTNSSPDSTGSCTSESGDEAGNYSSGAGQTTNMNYTYSSW